MWPLASSLHNSYEVPYKRLGTKPHGSIPYNNTQHLNKLLYVDDGVPLADPKDNLQFSLHNVNKTAKTYNTEISQGKILSFRNRDSVPSKIYTQNKVV
jgi:hypothetical protein